MMIPFVSTTSNNINVPAGNARWELRDYNDQSAAIETLNFNNIILGIL